MRAGQDRRTDAVVLRRAGTDDARAVADVLIRSRHAAVEIREWIRAVVIPQREAWLVESDDRRVLAMLVLDEDWIDQLYVDPGSTGMGLGSRLVELAKSNRPAGLQLWTFASNTGARRFYERHGFVVAEMTDGSDNEEQAPDVRYVWANG
jgi:GNAT superfamily N-acetyltransferase